MCGFDVLQSCTLHFSENTDSSSRLSTWSPDQYRLWTATKIVDNFFCSLPSNMLFHRVRRTTIKANVFLLLWEIWHGYVLQIKCFKWNKSTTWIHIEVYMKGVCELKSNKLSWSSSWDCRLFFESIYKSMPFTLLVDNWSRFDGRRSILGCFRLVGN